MNDSSFNLMIVFSSVGVALMLVGGASFLLASRSPFLRIPILVVCACSAALLPIFFATEYFAVAAVAGVFIAFLALLALGSRRLGLALQSASRFLRSPVGQGIVLGIFGLGLMAAAFIYSSTVDDESIDKDMALLAELAFTPPLHSAHAASTDEGKPVGLLAPDNRKPVAELTSNERKLLENLGYSERLIRTSPASDECNSHGWVFAAGKYWISPSDVDTILRDNGYQAVSDPRPGDLAIYRQNGLVVHTAIVRLFGEGSQIFVEGKWGWMGVFLHRADDSCYGKQYTFYRGTRSNHSLAGVDGKRADANREAD